jgi:hypothetical protein
MATPRHIFKFATLLPLIAVLCSGCVTHRDIVADSQYPTDYVIGAVYRTKQPLVAERADDSLFHTRYFFDNPKYRPTPSDVEAQPKQFARYLLVPANTDFRIERFDYEKNMENGNFVWIYGKVPGGTVEFDFSFVSRNVGLSSLEPELRLSPDLLMVDTNILERIEAK